MDFKIKNPGGNIVNMGRDIGYIFQGETLDKVSFVRPLERGGYPRFHLYIKMGEEMFFSLHLDQKRPVYKQAHDHAAEYEGAIIENEVERIKQALTYGVLE